jgi:hypothetical protein
MSDMSIEELKLELEKLEYRNRVLTQKLKTADGIEDELHAKLSAAEKEIELQKAKAKDEFDVASAYYKRWSDILAKLSERDATIRALVEALEEFISIINGNAGLRFNRADRSAKQALSDHAETIAKARGGV